MGSKITTQLSTFLLTTFVLWYLLRRTTIGIAFSNDMWDLPNRLGVMEGLRSAEQYIGK